MIDFPQYRDRLTNVVRDFAKWCEANGHDWRKTLIAYWEADHSAAKPLMDYGTAEDRMDISYAVYLFGPEWIKETQFEA